MKLFRVGSCLALLMAAACTQAPQNATAPTATSGGSSAATAADGSTLKVSAPALVSPAGGDRAEDRNPTLIWVNSTGRYGAIGVAYDLEVWLATGTSPLYQRTVGESPDTGAHRVDLTLEYDTMYSWRARAHLGNEVGPWSSFTNFVSPSRPVATTPTVTTTTGSSTCAAPLSPLGPGETRKPRPNDSAIARNIASQYPAAIRNSCQDHGGSWEFMDRVVDALRAKDGRYGYNCKRGNCNDPSLDVVSYYWDSRFPDINGRFEVYIFDIISGHCGATPSVIWTDVTDVTINSGTVGRTMYPRPGRNVTSANCGTAGQ